VVNESRRWRLMSSETEIGPFRGGVPEEAIGGLRGVSPRYGHALWR
jgi:hypothetical protein